MTRTPNLATCACRRLTQEVVGPVWAPAGSTSATDALFIRLLRTDVGFANRSTAFRGLGEVEIVGVRGKQRNCFDSRG